MTDDYIYAPPGDDIDQMFAEVAGDLGPAPGDLARDQADAAMRWLTDMRAGKGIRPTFRALYELIGRYIPGAYYIGGYAKTAKTTLCQTEARGQAERKIRVGYIGTETATSVLRLQSAAIHLGLPVGRVVAPSPEDPLSDRDTERVREDLQRQEQLARDGWLMYAEDHAQTLASARYWLRWCQREGCQMVFYDHIHRMDLGSESYYTALPDAVRALTSAATDLGVVLVCAAQLREDSHDKLANHEPPGDRQWFGTSHFQREATAALQLYRPFRTGTTEKQKKAVKLGQTPLRDILAVETIGLRCSAHRFRPGVIGELRRLRIVDDQVSDWPAHRNDPPPSEPPPAADGWWQR